MIKYYQAKIIIVLTFFNILASQLEAQTVTLNGSEPNSNMPFGQSNFHVSEHIYKHSELSSISTNSAAAINYIQFKVNGNSGSGKIHNTYLYLKNTSNEFLNNSTPNSFYGYTLVFHGDLFYNGNGLVVANLPIAFTYNNVNGNHLQLMVVRMFGPANPAIAFNHFLNTNPTGQFASRYYNHANLATQTDTISMMLSNLKPALQIGFIAPIIDEDMVNLNLTCFLSGRFKEGNTMQPFLHDLGFNFPNNICDFVTVELRSVSNPQLSVASHVGLLNTNGTLTCSFPSSCLNNSYYIFINHPHSMPVYSSQPVLMTNNTQYNFSNQANKAFGNNMKLMAPNLWGLHYGDYNSNYTIDANDWITIFLWLSSSWIVHKKLKELMNFYFPPAPPGPPPPADVAGDANVDAMDYLLLDPNIINTIQQP